MTIPVTGPGSYQQDVPTLTSYLNCQRTVGNYLNHTNFDNFLFFLI